MRFSGTDRDDDYAPWFRLGQLDVTTTTFIVLLWVVTLLVFTIEPVDKPIMSELVLIPGDVASGQVWRVVTWPWAHLQFGLFDIIAAAIFWIFGTDLERNTGRRRFTILMGASIVIIALCATLWGQLLGSETIIQDLDLLLLTVILLFVAEHPTRPFFFGIPAWVVGAVIVALELVNDLAYREWVRLLTVVLAAFLIAIVARKVGLLSMYDKIPDLRAPWRRKGDGGSPAAKGSSAPRPMPRSSAPKTKPRKKDSGKRPGRLWSRGEDEPAEIVEMPTEPRRDIRRVPVSTEPEQSVDDLALDALLDKIADGGLSALTPAERQELDELRARRRGSKR